MTPDEAPRLSGSLPGPLSRAELEAQRAVFYPGLTHGVYPFVAARKSGWLVEDLDGNVLVDLVSSSASVPFGAGRADLVAAATEQLLAFGNEDSHAVTNPLMSQLARRADRRHAGEPDPRRPVLERHRGRRDGGAVHAPGDRTPGHPRLLRRLPRRVHHDGRARRRAPRDRPGGPRPGRRVRARAVPEPLPQPVRRTSPGRHRGTAPSTSSGTRCCSTPSTRPRWRAW